MATGSGIGSLIPLAMTLAGVMTMLRARRARRTGRDADGGDSEGARRRADALEMERRMAAYLAQRRSAAYVADDDGNEQEIRR